MARAGRLAGAILAEIGGGFYLVGDIKEPCDWQASGFLPPGDLDAADRLWRPLQVCGTPRMEGPCLCFASEDEGVAARLAECFVIRRNGSVSERLWRLVWSSAPEQLELPAQWLLEMPQGLWEIVRDTVLRCS